MHSQCYAIATAHSAPQNGLENGELASHFPGRGARRSIGHGMCGDSRTCLDQRPPRGRAADPGKEPFAAWSGLTLPPKNVVPRKRCPHKTLPLKYLQPTEHEPAKGVGFAQF